ncbi:ABC transporter permease [uncultured Bifidobacterium sp.]|uniref:ABC transporter permease n=1 Tax=uncultured Bifidobacterium sp. TaxID=165187 RepID=UPI0028DCA555|nr:ABC transporter permease [uncultured Bifidobacterium sp.]
MRFVLGRLAMFAVALILVSVLVFVALRILPGDMASVMAGTNASPARVAALRTRFGLDRPLAEQYVDWVGGLARGDIGASMLTGRSVASQIAIRARITIPLILLSMAVALAVGLPAGCAAVLARRGSVRSAIHMVAVVGGSVPALWAGLLLLLLFGRGTGILGVLPSQGFPDDGWASPGRALESLALPALTVGVIVGAQMMRYVRSALAEAVSDDSVAMAMACGMTRREAGVRVGLRLAMPQLVSVVGLTLASMVTGVMVVESLFALPGLGSGLLQDVGNRDLLVVQSELFLLAALFLAIGLVVDLLHSLLDPRLRRARPEEGRA